ncbi:MAG: reprolysin-like metallopeptidase [Planctomycetota bacterium]
MKLLVSLQPAAVIPCGPLLSLAMCVAGSAAAVAAQSPAADRAFRAPRAAPTPGIGDDALAGQRRLVEVDLAALRAARPGLRLDLFDGGVAVAGQPTLRNAYGGGVTWDAPLGGDATGTGAATFSVFGDAVTATIRWRDRVYRVNPASADGAVHWLSELDNASAPPCGVDAPGVDLQRPARRHRDPPTAPTAPPPAARMPDVDILAVYSTLAKNRQGGTSAMLSLINLAIAETNQAYANSSVNQRVGLVHTEEMVGYTESSNFSTILSHLAGKSDGRMDQVHQLRDQYGADAVAMIVDNGQYCGIAYLMTTVSAGFEDSAFSVTNRGCATGYYSFGHELGHNFGCAHDPGSAGSAAYSYSYGYRTPDQRYRTIMAYAPGTRVQVFSGPSSSWAGYTMGNGSQNNARSMNNTASTVAAWRATASSGGSFTLNVANLVAGSTATLSTTGASPGRLVQTAYSVIGSGPVPTSFGPLALSPPVRLLAPRFATAAGTTSVPLVVPAPAVGRTVWFQAVDVFSATLSNGLQDTVR